MYRELGGKHNLPHIHAIYSGDEVVVDLEGNVLEGAIPRLLKVTPREDRSLVLEYDSGERKVFDVNPYISGSWYGELGEIPYFNAVSVVSGGSGIAWPHGQDIAPHELYELSVSY